ncbi:IclR family transcriptional regulator [Jannaschia sp.]|nr:IclR family transcriptional regulator [Jannaschia sp.]
MSEPSEEKNKAGASYVVSSVDRAMHLLLTLAEIPDCGVTELAEATKNTKSLTFRLLYTLEQRGMVRKNAERRTYSLGYRALLLGDQTRRQSRLISTAEPILADLSAATRENALLLVRQDHDSICIAMHASPEPLRIYASVGRLVPLHAGGGPKVLLAHADETVQRAVVDGPRESFTDKPVTDSATLWATLETVRAEGHAISIGELDPNIFSIAAPVRDHSGAVIAALAVNGPTVRLNDANQDKIRDTVMAEADRLSKMLGAR